MPDDKKDEGDVGKKPAGDAKGGGFPFNDEPKFSRTRARRLDERGPGPVERARIKVAENEERELLRRATAASETSARWAMWATILSVVALALSAWPYLRP